METFLRRRRLGFQPAPDGATVSARRFSVPLTAIVLCCALGCHAGSGNEAKAPSVAELRKNAERDSAQTSTWFVGEMLAPDGSPERAKKARQELDALKATDLVAELGRGLDDFSHG